jgi:hypothetical protein
MTTKVREGSRFGACTVLGELICETTTRYVYRRTRGDETFFVSKNSPSIHLQPCKGTSDQPPDHGTLRL